MQTCLILCNNRWISVWTLLQIASFLGCLPRGNKVKPLVAEYDHYIVAFCNPQDNEAVDKTLRSLPKGAKIVNRRIVSEEHDRDKVLKSYIKDLTG